MTGRDQTERCRPLGPAPADRRAIALSEWPEADRVAWQAAVRKRQPLEDHTPATLWAATTAAGVRAAYSCWLRWLGTYDEACLHLEARDRVTRASMGAYLSELRGTVSDAASATYLTNIAMAVRVISPGSDYPWLRAAVARLRQSGPSGRKSGRVVDSRELMELGISLMADARSRRDGPVPRRATLYRDGLMIALLALRPLRVKNFIEMQIGKHLSDKAGRKWISFAAKETKNRRAIDFPFPTNLLRHLKHYLLHVRPLLCAQTGGRNPNFPFMAAGNQLWVSETGSALRPKIFFTMTVRRTLKAFGRPVNPHLFRDCLVTTLSSEDADLAWVIPHVLGHKALRTSENHYNHALGMRETERFQEHVRSLRSAKRRC